MVTTLCGPLVIPVHLPTFWNADFADEIIQ